MWRILLSLSILCNAYADVSETLSIVTPTADNSVSRIIGGSPTTIQTYPYTVQVQQSNSLICGGSVLTTRCILSAAHCFVDERNIPLNPSLFSIRAGSTNINTGGVVHRVSVVVVHERYNTPIIRDNDIAILVLSSRLSYSTAVQPSAIPPQGYALPDNVTVVHVGWGRTSVNLPYLSEVLQQVMVRSVNRQACQSRYQWLTTQSGYPYPVTENMVCAGLLDVGGADACQGDSGGPLIYNNVVVGVTSWGVGCAEPNFPGVNARVASYTDWINTTVTRYSSSPPMKNVNSILIFLSLATSILALSKS